MMKKILLATDLTNNSDRAMERALKVAKEQKAKLFIIHIAPPYGGSMQKKWALDTKKDTEDLMRGYLSDYKDLGEVETEIMVKQGNEVFFEILEAAYKIRAGLIVMGMHGKEKFRDLFVGTTVERVVRKGIKPILMVKSKPIGPYKSVMAAIDFAAGSRAALRTAMEIAPEAKFCAVHVYNVPIYYPEASVYVETQEATAEANQKMMNAFLKTEHSYFKSAHEGEEKRLTGKLMEGIVDDTLRRKANNLKADLISIGTHGQPLFMPKLGGTAGDILSNPPCDILVTPEGVHE